MSKSKNLSGIALATAAAALFATSPIVATAADVAGSAANVKCYGVNACRERANCKTAENKCAGKNKCKGHSYVPVSAEICGQLGGVTRDDD